MKTYHLYGFFIIIFSFVLFRVTSVQSFKFNTTAEQIFLWQKSLKFIQEHTGKRCTKATLMTQQKFCKKRCDIFYEYIPTAPYKNYRYYNKTTKDCEPRVNCPSMISVTYNQKLNKCFDRVTGDLVPGVDSKPPALNPKGFQVQFVCVNGKVGYFKGRKDCICNFGWKSEYFQEDWYIKKFRLCTKGISIYEYLPVTAQIYYDPLLDGKWPHPADSQYWSKILVYYLRKYKNQFVASIWPIQVQLPLLMVPEQSFLRDQDMKYLGWIIISFLILIGISIYEKMKNSKTMQQIVAANSNTANVIPVE